jgi:hypothetical protein
MFARVKEFTSPVFNWEIASQPLNWVIIPIVLVLGGLVLGLIFHPASFDDGSITNAD